MHLYDVVLFLHVCAALSVIGLSALLHGCEWLSRGATTTAQLRILTRPARLGPVFGLFGATLVVLGFWLIGLSKAPDKFSIGDPFVWCGLAAIAVLISTWPLVMAPHAKRLAEAVAAAPDGPIDPALRALAVDPRAMIVGHADTFLVVAVIFDMITKPNAVVAVVVLLIGVAVGAALGNRGSRVPVTV